MKYVGTNEQLLDDGFKFVKEFNAFIKDCTYTHDGGTFEDILCVHADDRDIYLDYPQNSIDEVIRPLIVDLIELDLVVEHRDCMAKKIYVIYSPNGDISDKDVNHAEHHWLRKNRLYRVAHITLHQNYTNIELVERPFARFNAEHFTFYKGVDGEPIRAIDLVEEFGEYARQI